jgi:hypothetical protein
MFGQIFEDLFAEMKNGKVIKTGSRSSVDVIDDAGTKFSLKTQMLRTKMPIKHYFGAKIDIKFAKIASEKLFCGTRSLEVFQENIDEIYNNFQNKINKQVFLIRLLDNKKKPRGEFLYWEQPFETIDLRNGYNIFRNQGLRGKDKGRFESQISIKSSPAKIAWTSNSQCLIVYYKIPENADIIIINKDSSKMSWAEFIEKVK